jgi:hypothetical protein
MDSYTKMDEKSDKLSSEAKSPSSAALEQVDEDKAHDFQAVPDVVAISVVVIPPAEIVTKSQSINALIESEYKLDDRTHTGAHFAHITLFQSFVRKADLAELFKALDSVVSNREAVPLAVTGLEGGNVLEGSQSLKIKFAMNDQLVSLRNAAAEQIQKFSAIGDAKAFYKGQDESGIRKSHVTYVAEYPSKKGTIDSYVPHLTAGSGLASFVAKLKSEDLADIIGKKLLANSVAVCQLGNHCTCRRLLWETKLKPASK